MKLVYLLLFMFSLSACSSTETAINHSASSHPALPVSKKTIVNNSIWRDTNGHEIFANKGPKITKVGNTYYWVGVKHNNVKQLNIYSSQSFGSNSWTLAHQQTLRGIKGIRQTHMVQNPVTGKFLIYGKAAQEKSGELIILESHSPTGPFKVSKIIPCETEKFRPMYEFGDLSIYIEGKDTYMVVSRHHLNIHKTRHTAIYKLTPDGKALASEVYWKRWKRSESGGYESHYINKIGDTYVMTMSLTAGWNPSHSRYTTAPSLSGPWPTPIRIPTNPAKTPQREGTFESQHRWIMKVGEDWVYYGDRFPQQKQKKYKYHKANGSRIMLPVTWEGAVPTIHWQKEWSVNTK